MSLPIAIAFNIVLCVALLAALGWTLTRPRRLRPHVSASDRRLSLVQEEIRVDEEQDRRAA